jgi:hypothetical protein
MAIVRSVRNGRDNDPSFFSRMKPTGTWADLFRARFRLATRRLGINGAEREFRLDTSRFVRPERGGQLRLL